MIAPAKSDAPAGVIGAGRQGHSEGMPKEAVRDSTAGRRVPGASRSRHTADSRTAVVLAQRAQERRAKLWPREDDYTPGAARALLLRQLLKRDPGVALASQHDRILAALQTGPLTAIDMTLHLGIAQPHARMSWLRERGHRFASVWVAQADDAGVVHTVKLYSLAREGVNVP